MVCVAYYKLRKGEEKVNNGYGKSREIKKSK